MFSELQRVEFERARGLFAPLEYHLAIGSILAGKTPGRVFVDDPDAPGAAFTAFKHRLFLGGSPGNPGFNAGVREYLGEVLFPEARQAGMEGFVLDCAGREWEGPVEEILEGRSPWRGTRLFFECREVRHDWRKRLPEGFTLLPVDAALLARDGLGNLGELREELCSERSSVEEFLEKSFGFCILQGEELAAWCLSEYNTGDRCEVGVATVDKFQRQGLGTAVSLALVEHALANGYRRVGWHCWARNLPSGALARRAGFEVVREYGVWFVVGSDQ